MYFSPDTLHSTFFRFSQALDRRGLGLRPTAARNVWANIVLGRDYSAAASLVKAKDIAPAVAITIDSIRANLSHRSREVSNAGALEVFIEAIGDQLSELSGRMQELVEVVLSKEATCLIQATGDEYGLGVMDSEFSGYLGIAQLYNYELTEQEQLWFRASAEIIKAVVNANAGVKDWHLIHAANIRLRQKKEDIVFAKFCQKNLNFLCEATSASLLETFPPSEMADWDLDFDTVYNTVYAVFEHNIFEYRGDWLKIDCNLADAVMDHISVRLRETMKWMCDSVDEEVIEDPLGILTHSARLPMEKMLQMS